MLKKVVKCLVTSAMCLSFFSLNVSAESLDATQNSAIIQGTIPEDALKQNDIMSYVDALELDKKDESTESTEPNQAIQPAMDTFASPVPAADCSLAIEEGIYSIKLKDSDFYLDVYGAGDFNGNFLHTWNLNYNRAQLWHIKHMGNNEYAILNLMSGRSLEVAGSYNYNGAKIQIWDFWNIPTQRWKFKYVSESDPSQGLKLVNVNCEKVLDIVGSRQVRANKFHSWDDVNVPSQKYYLIKYY